MEVASRRRAELRERNISPERTKVWTEPRPRTAERKVPVVYYLSRNGHLEHPHFMEVSLPTGEGLYLRDVINRLNSLRGKGMGNMYSWSAKRSYKNGFVWHDLSEDDFIYPAHGNEYILKGSELLHPSSSQDELEEVPASVKDDSDISLRRKNRRTAWSSFDLTEYKVYKNKLTSETPTENTDAGTQTEDGAQNRRPHAIKEEEENPVTELARDEISPPSSTSSSETLEALIKADGRIVPIGTTIEKGENATNYSGRKFRAPAALMQLISCGSISVKDRGFSLVSHLKGRLPRAMSREVVKYSDGVEGNTSLSGVELEDKEYFSGSFIEMKKKPSDCSGELSGLRRSSSCNAERGLKIELAEKEIEGVRARCIPRKTKATATKKDRDPASSSTTNESKSSSDEPLHN